VFGMFKSLTMPAEGESGARQLLFLSLLCLIAVAMNVSCGTESRPTILDNPNYDGWLCFQQENVRIYHVPGHPQEANFGNVAAGYKAALNKVCSALNMPVPEGPIDVVFYTGWGQGREITGEEYPFVKDGVIHFWLPSYLGVTFMHWLLPQWIPTEPRHRFLKHGLITVWDYSGNDYHLTLLKFRKAGRFIPLAQLAVDTTIDSNTERRQSSEAASFVSFVLGNYGPDTLKTMYQSELPFDTLVAYTLGVTTDSLEQLWVKFAELNVRPEGLKELDEIQPDSAGQQ